MLPPAPGLFSITTCWPHISESRAPRMRPIPSMPPPGVNGTTSFTKRLGQPDGEGACAAVVRRRARTGEPPPGRGARAGRSCWVSRAISLVDLDFRFADDRAPFIHFGVEKDGKLLRRRADQRRAELLQPLLDHGMAERCDHVLVDLFDDGGGVLAGTKKANQVETSKPGTPGSWHRRRTRAPTLPATNWAPP